MLKAKVEWLEVRLGLRVTKRLLDKNRVETLDPYYYYYYWQ